ncbi:MAG: hypothetical protein ACRDH9_07230, partial [Actinomycetota bacterium]
MPTAEPSARYMMPHTTETGAIRTAIRMRSAFFRRRSSPSRGSAPIRASNAAPLAIQPIPGRGRFRDEAVARSVTLAERLMGGSRDERPGPLRPARVAARAVAGDRSGLRAGDVNAPRPPPLTQMFGL